MKSTIPFLLLLTVMHACSPAKNLDTNLSNISINGKMFATLFQVKAAEYRALCYQGYNIARWRIVNYTPVDSRPLAIITDIDETIFDNSAYAISRGLQGKDYEPASWFEYTAGATADTMPGAASFLKFVADRGIEIFYVTNREAVEREGTLLNLQKFNLPNADSIHLFTKEGLSSKEERRKKISNTHQVILLMGDNLADFSFLFDKQNQEDRQRATDSSSSSFGNMFIVFPNTVYGDWEAALFNYNYSLTPLQKDSVIKQSLRKK